MALLEVSHLSVAARSRAGLLAPIVSDVSFALEPGKVIALIGETGSGKSTIALACMGYARPGCTIVGGGVRLDGTDLLTLGLPARRRIRGAQVAYVAQSAAAAFNAALTLDYQVTETPVVKGLLTREEARRASVSLYRQLDLPDPEHIGSRYPHQVSGGQLQRFMVAMAMICGPRLLILDEPTTALDVSTQIEMLQVLKRLIRGKQISTIHVSHDLAVVAQVADEILVLRDGAIVEQGPTERIIHAPAHDYSRKLLAAAQVMPKSLPVAASPRPGPPAASPPLLAVRGVSAGYGSRPGPLALRSASLELGVGQTLGIIGESGSGKTTLGRVIAGLTRPRSGEVRLAGTVLAGSVRDRSREDLRVIQFAFQLADVALNPRHRIGKILGRPYRFYFGLSDAEIDRRVSALLELVRMPASFAAKFPRELSGGQRQRVNLARALAAEPKLIICDEITSALDTIVTEAILDLLRSIQEQRKLSFIFISHDISLVARISNTMAVMWRGEIVEQGTTPEILTAPRHDHTRSLLSSVPELRTDWLDEVSAARRDRGSLTIGR
jgi:peptide/nickel transport system ATP-binding protein